MKIFFAAFFLFLVAGISSVEAAQETAPNQQFTCTGWWPAQPDGKTATRTELVKLSDSPEIISTVVIKDASGAVISQSSWQDLGPKNIWNTQLAKPCVYFFSKVPGTQDPHSTFWRWDLNCGMGTGYFLFPEKPNSDDHGHFDFQWNGSIETFVDMTDCH